MIDAMLNGLEAAAVLVGLWVIYQLILAMVTPYGK